MALIATQIRLSAMAWLIATCFYGPVALAFDARSPFGENGRDDWHSADHNWDGSPVAIPLRASPAATLSKPSIPKLLALVDKTAASASPSSGTMPVVIVAASALQSGGSAPPSGQPNNAISLVNTLLSNVTSTSLVREVALGSNTINNSSQVTLSSQGRINIRH